MGDYQKNALRDNMLVTIGLRAGHMDYLDYIQLDGSEYGEEEFAKYAAKVVDEYRASDHEICFDEFIEVALEKKYGKKGTDT